MRRPTGTGASVSSGVVVGDAALAWSGDGGDGGLHPRLPYTGCPGEEEGRGGEGGEGEGEGGAEGVAKAAGAASGARGTPRPQPLRRMRARVRTCSGSPFSCSSCRLLRFSSSHFLSSVSGCCLTSIGFWVPGRCLHRCFCTLLLGPTVDTRSCVSLRDIWKISLVFLRSFVSGSRLFCTVRA